jgi:hypothetical protein
MTFRCREIRLVDCQTPSLKLTHTGVALGIMGSLASFFDRVKRKLSLRGTTDCTTTFRCWLSAARDRHVTIGEASPPDRLRSRASSFRGGLIIHRHVDVNGVVFFQRDRRRPPTAELDYLSRKCRPDCSAAGTNEVRRHRLKDERSAGRRSATHDDARPSSDLLPGRRYVCSGWKPSRLLPLHQPGRRGFRAFEWNSSDDPPAGFRPANRPQLTVVEHRRAAAPVDEAAALRRCNFDAKSMSGYGHRGGASAWGREDGLSDVRPRLPARRSLVQPRRVSLGLATFYEIRKVDDNLSCDLSGQTMNDDDDIFSNFKSTFSTKKNESGYGALG